jgi:hypothetical protein
MGALALGLVACSDFSDEDKINTLNTAELTTLCNEVCDGAAWEVKCGEVTFSRPEKAECTTVCLYLKGVGDNCTMTVGDVRLMNSKPTSCEEGPIRERGEVLRKFATCAPNQPQ